MTSEKFCLRWNDFETNISGAFRELREDKDFFDVTLACDDEQIEAHKVILSACSPFFRTVLKRNRHEHPLLYLKGVKYVDLVAVLNFMYHGEVNVAQEELNSFLAVAEDLRVKGLTQNNTGTSSQRKESPTPKRAPPEPIPPPKRPRPMPSQPPPTEDDDIQEVMPSVKSEPRDLSATNPGSYPAQPDVAHQSLAQVEDYAEEAYEEDYGQYEDGAESYAMMGQAGAEGNKGYVESCIRKAEENLYVCLMCSKTSTRKQDISNHVENIHFPGNYPCRMCQKTFKSRNSLSVHCNRNHKENVNAAPTFRELGHSQFLHPESGSQPIPMSKV